MADRLNLVFDLDGTLIDSAPDIHAAANKVFTSNGLQPFPFAVIRDFIGNGVGVLVSRLLSHQGLPPDGDLHRNLIAQFINLYEEAFDLTVLYPGVSTALSQLAEAGHQLAICTNKPEGPARAALRQFDLAQFFPVVIGGDTLAERKPHPAPLLAALSALGAHPAVFVGDSEVDAETARSAAVPLALFTAGYRKTDAQSLGAKLIFDDYAALPRLLAHLAPRL